MTSCEEEVKRIGTKLDKVIDGTKSDDDAIELLEALSNMPMNIDVLTKTQIGKKINEFRKKTNDERLAKKAKLLIKEWKNCLEKKELPRNDSTASNLSQKSNDSSSNSTSHKNNSIGHLTSTSNGFPPKHLQSDDLRCKSAQMILNALRYAEMPDGTLDPEDLAVKIEDALFTIHKGTGDRYKSALRSRVFNLRDKKNPALRENVLTGVVKPERVAVMTSEEMASDEVRQMREKFNKESINEHQMSVQQGTPSEMFKCGKCGKKNCTYSQLQTRSSDEPMTTFVYCLECGNRWKFC